MSTLGHQYDNSLVSNAFGFLRLPMNFQPYDSDADWVITGVPFDMATSGRAGGRHGPAAIRQVSTNLAWEHNRFPWNFDMRERLNVVDCGDLVYAFGDAREMSEKLQAHAEKLLAAGKRMLSFGGDHFVTLPLLRAHAKHFGKMALVHFDAHTDTYANGCEFDHGTMFYTAPKEGLIDPNHSVQIGIRTEFDKDNGFTVLDACQVNDRSVDDVIAQVKQIVGDMPVYLTFDIDCLDPAFAPGTGTPVIGGLTSDRAIKLVRGLKDLNIVGMDVVEVAPAYDQSEITALALCRRFFSEYFPSSIVFNLTNLFIPKVLTLTYLPRFIKYPSFSKSSSSSSKSSAFSISRSISSFICTLHDLFAKLYKKFLLLYLFIGGTSFNTVSPYSLLISSDTFRRFDIPSSCHKLSVSFFPVLILTLFKTI